MDVQRSFKGAGQWLDEQKAAAVRAVNAAVTSSAGAVAPHAPNPPQQPARKRPQKPPKAGNSSKKRPHGTSGDVSTCSLSKGAHAPEAGPANATAALPAPPWPAQPTAPTAAPTPTSQSSRGLPCPQAAVVTPACVVPGPASTGTEDAAASQAAPKPKKRLKIKYAPVPAVSGCAAAVVTPTWPANASPSLYQHYQELARQAAGVAMATPDHPAGSAGPARTGCAPFKVRPPQCLAASHTASGKPPQASAKRERGGSASSVGVPVKLLRRTRLQPAPQGGIDEAQPSEPSVRVCVKVVACAESVWASRWRGRALGPGDVLTSAAEEPGSCGGGAAQAAPACAATPPPQGAAAPAVVAEAAPAVVTEAAPAVVAEAAPAVVAEAAPQVAAAGSVPPAACGAVAAVTQLAVGGRGEASVKVDPAQPSSDAEPGPGGLLLPAPASPRASGGACAVAPGASAGCVKDEVKDSSAQAPRPAVNTPAPLRHAPRFIKSHSASVALAEPPLAEADEKVAAAAAVGIASNGACVEAARASEHATDTTTSSPKRKRSAIEDIAEVGGTEMGETCSGVGDAIRAGPGGVEAAQYSTAQDEAVVREVVADAVRSAIEAAAAAAAVREAGSDSGGHAAAAAGAAAEVDTETDGPVADNGATDQKIPDVASEVQMAGDEAGGGTAPCPACGPEQPAGEAIAAAPADATPAAVDSGAPCAVAAADVLEAQSSGERAEVSTRAASPERSVADVAVARPVQEPKFEASVAAEVPCTAAQGGGEDVKTAAEVLPGGAAVAGMKGDTLSVSCGDSPDGGIKPPGMSAGEEGVVVWEGDGAPEAPLDGAVLPAAPEPPLDVAVVPAVPEAMTAVAGGDAGAVAEGREAVAGVPDAAPRAADLQVRPGVAAATPAAGEHADPPAAAAVDPLAHPMDAIVAQEEQQGVGKAEEPPAADGQPCVEVQRSAVSTGVPVATDRSCEVRSGGEGGGSDACGQGSNGAAVEAGARGGAATAAAEAGVEGAVSQGTRAKRRRLNGGQRAGCGGRAGAAPAAPDASAVAEDGSGHHQVEGGGNRHDAEDGMHCNGTAACADVPAQRQCSDAERPHACTAAGDADAGGTVGEVQTAVLRTEEADEKAGEGAEAEPHACEAGAHGTSLGEHAERPAAREAEHVDGLVDTVTVSAAESAPGSVVAEAHAKAAGAVAVGSGEQAEESVRVLEGDCDAAAHGSSLAGSVKQQSGSSGTATAEDKAADGGEGMAVEDEAGDAKELDGQAAGDDGAAAASGAETAEQEPASQPASVAGAEVILRAAEELEKDSTVPQTRERTPTPRRVRLPAFRRGQRRTLPSFGIALKGRALQPSAAVAALLRQPVAAAPMEVRVAWVTTGDEAGGASEGDVCVAVCADAEVAQESLVRTAACYDLRRLPEQAARNSPSPEYMWRVRQAALPAGFCAACDTRRERWYLQPLQACVEPSALQAAPCAFVESPWVSLQQPYHAVEVAQAAAIMQA